VPLAIEELVGLRQMLARHDGLARGHFLGDDAVGRHPCGRRRDAGPGKIHLAMPGNNDATTDRIGETGGGRTQVVQ